MSCSSCRLSAPTGRATFHNNVGMLFMRRVETSDGHFCRACLRRLFAHHMGRNLVLGWWGIISFFFTLYFFANNTVELISARRELARRARRRKGGPVSDAGARLEAFRFTIERRLAAGDTVDDISCDLADATDVPVDQVRDHVARLAAEPAEPVEQQGG
jgi:hypothetical protein